MIVTLRKKNIAFIKETNPLTLNNMRKKGCKFEYREERDNELLSVFRKVYSESKTCRRLDELLTDVINHRTKRFWISAERASIVISSMKKGRSISHMKPHKQEMFHEIYRRLLLLEKEHPETPTLQLLEMVVDEEAPSFYISVGAASVILHYIKKRKRCLGLKSF